MDDKINTILNVSRETFDRLFDLMVEKNKVLNLTTITEYKEVVIKHFADSLEIIRVLPDIDTYSYNIIDVGTGAGYPGLPLAIAFPNIKITLTDSLNKRIEYINEVVEKLGLKNVTTMHGRAEILGRNTDFREKYDVSVARAVANLSTLSEYCSPFIHKNGLFIAYKSLNAEEELHAAENALKELNLKHIRTESYELPENMGSRSLIVLKKTNNTPGRYPRKEGVPSRKPL